MKKIKLIYIGRRIGTRGKSVQVFLHGKKEMNWTGIRGLEIGAEYEAAQKADGGIQMKVRPTVIRFLDARQEWIDADTATRTKLAQSREREKARREAENLWPHVKPLYDRAAKLGYFEKYAFGQAVARLISSGRKK